MLAARTRPIRPSCRARSPRATSTPTDRGRCRRRARPRAQPLRAAIAPHVDLHRGAPTYSWAYKALAEAQPAELYVVLGTCHTPVQGHFAATAQGLRHPARRGAGGRRLPGASGQPVGPRSVRGRVLARGRALDRVPGGLSALARSGRRRRRADRADPVRLAAQHGAARATARATWRWLPISWPPCAAR